MPKTFGKLNPRNPQPAVAGHQQWRTPEPAQAQHSDFAESGKGFSLGFLGRLISFSGRAGRLEWWGINFGVIAVWFALLSMFGIQSTATGEPNVEAMASAGPIFLVSLVAVLIITIAVSVRRYHDHDKSGWWYLICLVPIIGPIWQFVELGFLSGGSGVNAYGKR